MSIDTNYYVIAGYNLTKHINHDKYEDWMWSEEWENYTNYQNKGYIQLFYDPMNNNYLYFGYTLVSGNGWDFESDSFYMQDIEEVKQKIYEELLKLIEIGVIKNDALLEQYKVIAFVEYS